MKEKKKKLKEKKGKKREGAEKRLKTFVERILNLAKDMALMKQKVREKEWARKK